MTQTKVTWEHFNLTGTALIIAGAVITGVGIGFKEAGEQYLGLAIFIAGITLLVVPTVMCTMFRPKVWKEESPLGEN